MLLFILLPMPRFTPYPSQMPPALGILCNVLQLEPLLITISCAGCLNNYYLIVHNCILLANTHYSFSIRF